tara:strand:- start:195 stop:407 length:213 start_codon:yes stop_codon:yes gene_type:complete
LLSFTQQFKNQVENNLGKFIVNGFISELLSFTQQFKNQVENNLGKFIVNGFISELLSYTQQLIINYQMKI